MIIVSKWEGIHLSSFMFFSTTFVVSGYWITHIVLSLVGTSCTSLQGHDKRPLVGWKTQLSVPLRNSVLQGQWNQHRWSTGLPNGWISRCRGNRILLLLRGGKPNSVLLVHDKQMYFIAAVYRGFSFNLKKRSFCWAKHLISLVFTLCKSVNWRQQRMIVDIVSGMPCFPCYKVLH